MNKYKVVVLAEFRMSGTMDAPNKEWVEEHIQHLVNSANEEFSKDNPKLNIERIVGVDIQETE